MESRGHFSPGKRFLILLFSNAHARILFKFVAFNHLQFLDA